MIMRYAFLPAFLLLFASSGGESSAGSGSGGAGNSGSGGAGSGGLGNAGSGDAGMHPPVGTCDNLPAPGMWQDVTPPGESSKPAVNGTVGGAIIVDPFDPRTVWLGTGS